MKRRVQLGPFEVDFEAQELRKGGRRVKLQDQPFQILTVLLERPGGIVAREELQECLWPDDTVVDFDRGLGTAMGKLRAALDDSAKQPRYIETIPRRGFRLIAPVQELIDADMATASPTRRRFIHGAIVAALVLGAVSFFLLSERDPADARPLESVAVLPLDDISGNVEEAYFAAGMTDALIHSIAQIPTLEVISRTSVLQYDETKKPLPQIAQELGVEAIVEGTVQRIEGRVRITVQLIDARRDRHVWSESFTREMSDVLAVQNDVALEVARRMEADVNPELRARMGQAASVSPEAHESYLKGRFIFNQTRGTEAFERAIRYFESAVRLDPTFAAAHAALAVARNRLRYGRTIDRTLAEKAKSAAMRALELDPYLAEGHAALGNVLEQEYDWQTAEREYKRAIELAPNNANAHGLYASHLVRMGRWDEAIGHADTAKRLDPVPVFRIMYPAIPLVNAGRFDESESICQEALAFHGDNYMPYTGLGINAFARGEVEEAVRYLESAARLSGRQRGSLSWLARAYAAAGREDALRAIYDELAERSQRGEVVSAALGIVAKELGQTDEAYEWLERADAEGDPVIMDLNLDFFSGFRGEPRFEELKHRLGLPDLQEGSWHFPREANRTSVPEKRKLP